MKTKKPVRAGGLSVSGGSIKLEAEALPAQPEGWPRNDAPPAFHAPGDPKLDGQGDDAEES